MVVQWYRFLDRAIKIPGRANAELLARVAIDQVVFTPVNMLLFFSTMAVLEVLGQICAYATLPEGDYCMLCLLADHFNINRANLQWRNFEPASSRQY